MQIGHIKKWAEFQHYKDRMPPWIKLDRKLLDDYEFSRLQLASKALAPLLWLLASESTDGTVRVDPEWLAFRLRWDIQEATDGISGLIDNGFVLLASNVLATCKQPASPEIETEIETDIPTANAVGVGFEKSDEADSVNGQTEKRQAEGSHEDGDQGSKPARVRVPYTDIVAVYHEILVPAGCPRFEVMSREREGLMRQRWLQHMPSLDQWRNYLSYVGKSKFLTGKTDPKPGQPPFVADLEWLCRPRNFAKVAEGKYHR